MNLYGSFFMRAGARSGALRGGKGSGGHGRMRCRERRFPYALRRDSAKDFFAAESSHVNLEATACFMSEFPQPVPRLPMEAGGGSWALRFGERRYNACPKCGANVRGIHSRALSGRSACGTLRFPAHTCRTRFHGFAQPCGIHASGLARPRVCGRANIARSFGRLRRMGRTYGALPHTPPGN